MTASLVSFEAIITTPATEGGQNIGGKENMPEEKQEAASIAEETTSQPESAPVEENASETEAGQSEASEKTETTTETAQEKMVPLTALQQERQRRKEAEEYVKSLQSTYPTGEVEEEAPAEPQRQYMTRDEYEFLEGERRRWQEAESTFPELKNPEIRDLAEARRERALLKTGKYLTIEEASRQTVDILKKARSEGQKAAQESVSIQQREQIESTGSSVNKGAAESAIETIKTSRDDDKKRAALLEILKNQ